MITIVVVVVVAFTVMALLGKGFASAQRANALAEQTPLLAELAESLGGELMGPDKASTWSPKLRWPALTLAFQRGPWHVRVSETSRARGPGRGDTNVIFAHWIEIATVPVPHRRLPLEFFELIFEDGFVRVECGGQIQADELVFLVDMIVETLDLMSGVEPRDPSAIV
ncbi:hypothetical protein SK803_42400 [Lentzea sp. BCCO 10_0856]|uniref:Uncharacterized protein n=1 Tax=Lentzea miocenica TaxID=3095431 RepID=A0ABU4TFD5_9PSEU|nr:hypothetical protein [Lentzea sp. BCCO 10_0856]MDX8036888.1 hypothetical protein [Lentzea sp. BCCO 10_0856]